MVCPELRKGSEMAGTTMAEWRGWNSWDSWSSDLFGSILAGPVYQQFVGTRFWHSARMLSWHGVQNMLTIQVVDTHSLNPWHDMICEDPVHSMHSFMMFHWFLTMDCWLLCDLLGGFHCEPVTIALRWGEDRIGPGDAWSRNGIMGYHQPKET